MSNPLSSTNVPILTTANYSLWAPAMEDYLWAKAMWYHIHTSPPSVTVDAKGYRKCMEARDQAVGEIRRHLSPELRSVATASHSMAERIVHATLLIDYLWDS